MKIELEAPKLVHGVVQSNEVIEVEWEEYNE